MSRLAGLEIGPRNAPLVSKADSAVRYVDYATTEEMRRTWDKPHIIDPATFVEVDIVWGSAPLPKADYIVASHVMEHVPDLAGWLGEMREALAEGGALCLALPDRRFTFDLLRSESSLSEVVEAYLLEYRKPSIRQVFDAAYRCRPVDAADAWRENLKEGLTPIAERLPSAFALARSLVDRPRYQDTHCWVFTPRSFLELARGLHALGLFPFRVEAFQPTPRGELEFYARLIPASSPDEIAASIDAAAGTLATADRAPEDVP